MSVLQNESEMKILQRLSELRELMAREHLDAFVFPSTDPHNSEYVPDRWKGREWVSGFNGSAGTAVVTQSSAALWTDSRYFLAAEDQLRGTGYQLMKLKVAGTPTIAEWLGKELSHIDGAQVGVDGMVNNVASVEDLVAELRRQGGITVRTNFDPLATLWSDRPAIPEGEVGDTAHGIRRGDGSPEDRAHTSGVARAPCRRHAGVGPRRHSLDTQPARL
jgi:Xaa-Pro aminopeptidase